MIDSDSWHQSAKVLEAKLEARGESFVLATVIRAVAPTSAKAGDKAVITEDGVVHGWVGGSCAEPTVRREAELALADGACRVVQITPDPNLPLDREGLVVVPMSCYSGGELEIYLEPHCAKNELVVFGNSPVAKALVELGGWLGYRVTAVDTTERPPMPGTEGTEVIREIGEVEIAHPEKAAAVIATHGVFDEDAIGRAVALQPSYLGVVTSVKRFASLQSSMKQRGISAEAWIQIDGPAGIDIGARTPQEIALSVMATITAQRESIAVTARRPSRSADGEGAQLEPLPSVATANAGKSGPGSPVDPSSAPAKSSCCHSDSE
jgi:xanthine dehydrogenase accessory factor